jgi:hypothetical protein
LVGNAWKVRECIRIRLFFFTYTCCRKMKKKYS